MTAEENKAILIHFIGELRKGNYGIIDEVCSPDFAFYSPNYHGWPRGLEGARAIASLGRKIFRDAEGKIEDIFGVGDRVAVRWSTRGIYQGEAKPGFPVPGEHCTMGAISIYRFVDGKIVEDWGVEAFSAAASAW